MLIFEMSSPVILSSKASELPTNGSRATGVMTKVALVTMTSLVTEKVFCKSKCKVIDSARRFGTSEWFVMIFLVATV
jgi:hypothetical protein